MVARPTEWMISLYWVSNIYNKNPTINGRFLNEDKKMVESVLEEFVPLHPDIWAQQFTIESEHYTKATMTFAY